MVADGQRCDDVCVRPLGRLRRLGTGRRRTRPGPRDRRPPRHRLRRRTASIRPGRIRPGRIRPAARTARAHTARAHTARAHTILPRARSATSRGWCPTWRRRAHGSTRLGCRLINTARSGPISVAWHDGGPLFPTRSRCTSTTTSSPACTTAWSRCARTVRPRSAPPPRPSAGCVHRPARVGVSGRGARPAAVRGGTRRRRRWPGHARPRRRLRLRTHARPGRPARHDASGLAISPGLLGMPASGSRRRLREGDTVSMPFGDAAFDAVAVATRSSSPATRRALRERPASPLGRSRSRQPGTASEVPGAVSPGHERSHPARQADHAPTPVGARQPEALRRRPARTATARSCAAGARLEEPAACRSAVARPQV